MLLIIIVSLLVSVATGSVVHCRLYRVIAITIVIVVFVVVIVVISFVLFVI